MSMRCYTETASNHWKIFEKYQMKISFENICEQIQCKSCRLMLIRSQCFSVLLFSLVLFFVFLNLL